MTADEKRKEIENLARQVLQMAHDTILMNLRFLEIAMSALEWVSMPGTGRIASAAGVVYYDPVLLLRRYRNDKNSIVRLYLHILFHMIFHHNYEYERLNMPQWDLAVDISVEAVILDLELYHAFSDKDAAQKQKLHTLEKRAGGLSAPKLYRLFRIEDPSDREKEELYLLFHRDIHELWKQKAEGTTTVQKWDKISERVRADLKSFSKNKTGSESLSVNLDAAAKKRVDYREFLRQFMVMGEEIHVNDEEFDYIYYTYGLSHYGNMPLVEPLEYQDVSRVREFVVALDTSASCRGELVKGFLLKTWEILQSEETFFGTVNLHIIMCDQEVREDIKLENREDLDRFLKNGKLVGGGATDFRPVFDYVKKLQEEGEFINLKGLLYFTDGYGIYPEGMPDYKTAFVFLQKDEMAPKVPSWAIRIELEDEQLEEALKKETERRAEEAAAEQEQPQTDGIVINLSKPTTL